MPRADLLPCRRPGAVVAAWLPSKASTSAFITPRSVWGNASGQASARSAASGRAAAAFCVLCTVRGGLAAVDVAGKDGDVEERYIRWLERGELEVQVAEDQQARGRAGSGRGQIRQFSDATPNTG